MAFDLSNVSKITYQQHIDDALASGDIKRLRFLEDISSTTAPRKNKKTGEMEDAPITLMAIRSKYLQEYHGYKPTPKKQSTFAARAAMLAAAFEMMKAKK